MPCSDRSPPGRLATQASSQISKPIFTPPQSKTRSPIGILLPVQQDRVAEVHRPGLEPAGLVVQAVAGQEALGDEPGDAAVDGHAGHVEQGVAVQQGQAQADDHARVVSGTTARSTRRASSWSPAEWNWSSQP